MQQESSETECLVKSIHKYSFDSSTLVPHFLSLFDILLSVVLDPGCSLQ